MQGKMKTKDIKDIDMLREYRKKAKHKNITK